LAEKELAMDSGEGSVILSREDGCLVFAGSTGWHYRVASHQVDTDAKLQEFIEHLSKKTWMTHALIHQFEDEIDWLRSQP
jgi:hypothetical protein